MKDCEFYFEASDGTRIRYLDKGKGKAMIFPHGFGCCADDFEKQFKILSKRFRCISFDQRGYGGTPLTENASLQQSARDLHQSRLADITESYQDAVKALDNFRYSLDQTEPTDAIFSAAVTEISDAYTDSGGNVIYDVTITIEGDTSGLFQGMTGDIVLIESRVSGS